MYGKEQQATSNNQDVDLAFSINVVVRVVVSIHTRHGPVSKIPCLKRVVVFDHDDLLLLLYY